MLTTLRLTGYRNLEDGRLTFPEAGVALVGANAQGKTNLLEAIYYLEIFRSFRGSPDSRIIRFGEEHFRIEGHLSREARTTVVTAAYQRRGQVKKVGVDGVEPPRLGDAIGRVGAVLFTPEDVRIVSDGPEERRRFLDILLSLNLPGYLEALQRFRQALAQRNAALKAGGGDASIRAWDAALVRAGGTVHAARAGWIGGRREAFRSVFGEISGGEEAELRYRPGSGPEPVPEEVDRESWAVALARRLEEGLAEDRRQGVTRAGPHRDDFRIHLIQEPDGNGGARDGADAEEGTARRRDLRHYGSGGQRRTAALALRVLEARTVQERRGEAPILLLDDVFAELDADRSERVVRLLDRTVAGQVILTAPKEADLLFRADRLARWSVRDGMIHTGDARGSAAAGLP